MEQCNIVLTCKRVKFFSHHDEDAFFEWVGKIECIKQAVGKRDAILLIVKDKKISEEELFDILALFRRYKINKKQLDIFLDETNRETFYQYQNGFHINVYPAQAAE